MSMTVSEAMVYQVWLFWTKCPLLPRSWPRAAHEACSSSAPWRCVRPPSAPTPSGEALTPQAQPMTWRRAWPKLWQPPLPESVVKLYVTLPRWKFSSDYYWIQLYFALAISISGFIVHNFAMFNYNYHLLNYKTELFHTRSSSSLVEPRSDSYFFFRSSRRFFRSSRRCFFCGARFLGDDVPSFFLLSFSFSVLKIIVIYVSISPTFYVRIFLYLKFGSILFRHKKIIGKAALKMLVKFTIVD